MRFYIYALYTSTCIIQHDPLVSFSPRRCVPYESCHSGQNRQNYLNPYVCYITLNELPGGVCSIWRNRDFRRRERKRERKSDRERERERERNYTSRVRSKTLRPFSSKTVQNIICYISGARSVNARGHYHRVFILSPRGAIRPGLYIAAVFTRRVYAVRTRRCNIEVTIDCDVSFERGCKLLINSVIKFMCGNSLWDRVAPTSCTR